MVWNYELKKYMNEDKKRFRPKGTIIYIITSSKNGQKDDFHMTLTLNNLDIDNTLIVKQAFVEDKHYKKKLC